MINSGERGNGSKRQIKAQCGFEVELTAIANIVDAKCEGQKITDMICRVLV